ncbi:MAG: hypothetical protein ACOVVK_09325 [Elsteraceae bacterium]
MRGKRGLKQDPSAEGAGVENFGEPSDSRTMEARIAKVEAGIEHLVRETQSMRADIRDIRSEHRADFRLTWGGMIALAIGLAAMMAKGFKWI